MAKKMTFALAFCNRGFMPGELIYGARDDMIKAVTDAGYDYIAMDASLTRYGGIETRDEGLLYAKWLKQHEGEYDGVIVALANFVVYVVRFGFLDWGPTFLKQMKGITNAELEAVYTLAFGYYRTGKFDEALK